MGSPESELSSQSSLELIKKLYVQKYGDDFLDRLDKTRNPDRFKRRLIKLYKIREKNDKDLLRKYFNKWRQKILEDNVKYLKSKIMYKLYDKNTSGQDKELLNKYFQRWKNLTFKDNLRKFKTDYNKIVSKQEDTKRLFVKSIVNGLDKRTNKDL